MTSIPRIGLLAALGALLVACGGRGTAPPAADLAVADMLGSSDPTGFERAVEPREFSFPQDHGPHQAFRTEWWYYTGNLTDSSGRRFGYQLTFFKNALTGEPAERDSEWGTNQVFMAHFALTDARRERFFAFERFARRALGLAGARAVPFRVWLEDWSSEETPGGGMRLRAAEDDVRLDLTLEPGKPPVLQGDAGLSQKGSGAGNASYYYSLTRMPTRGRIEVGSEAFEVAGTSWMDREWSTSVLEEGQIGWDWFSLQLADERELMVYVIRREDGSADPNSAGTVVEPSGAYRKLEMGDWRLEATGSWTSPEGGARYPAGWKLAVPAEDLELEIRPLIADQELRHTFSYWEGAVEVTGASRGEPIEGRGYVELTGY